MGAEPHGIPDPLMQRVELESLLMSILRRRQPALARELEERRSVGGLDESLRERSRLVIADELIDYGLDAGEEHNAYGLKLSQIIDYLGHL